jgi:CRP/FNR family cyclic AMP-dependent transcriptional regulator
MEIAHVLGWIAAGLVLTSFYLKTMMPLRIVALGSNLAFIAYGILVGATPVFVLHSLLLPLNVLRLVQMWRFKQQVEAVALNRAVAAVLLPYMRQSWVPAGKALFHKGDDSDEVYYVIQGEVRLLGTDSLIKAGELLGEMDVFMPDGMRLSTAICETEVQLGSISSQKIREILFQNPVFSEFLLRAIAHRAANSMQWASTKYAPVLDGQLS